VRVLPIKNEETYAWLLHKHYAKRIPQIMFAFGLYEDICDEIGGGLIGVVTYGIPASPSLCMGICGKEYSTNVLELNRLCLQHNDKNQSSFLVSNSIKLLPKPSIVVSYADTAQGHIGYVYQATNFLYTGLSANRVDWTVKGLEHKHSKTLSDGMTLESIKQKYGDDFYYAERSRKHRYIYFHGNKTQKKQMNGLLKYKIEQYPKGDSKKYDSGKAVETQTLLFG
jgi:hypothetical protein